MYMPSFISISSGYRGRFASAVHAPNFYYECTVEEWGELFYSGKEQEKRSAVKTATPFSALSRGREGVALHSEAPVSQRRLRNAMFIMVAVFRAIWRLVVCQHNGDAESRWGTARLHSDVPKGGKRQY